MQEPHAVDKLKKLPPASASPSTAVSMIGGNPDLWKLAVYQVTSYGMEAAVGAVGTSVASLANRQTIPSSRPSCLVPKPLESKCSVKATAAVLFDEALGIMNAMPPDAPVPSKVFVSYSHDSPEHKGRVRDLSDRLRREGIDSNIDQYEQSPPEGWPRWMGRQIEEADFVLVVCTETYERRYRGVEDPGRGLGGSWEGAIVNQHLYEAQAKNTRFIPVLFSSQDEAHIPFVLRGTTRYRVDAEEGYVRLYRHLTAQPEVRRPELGNRRVLPPLDSEPGSATSEDEYSDAEQVIRRHCEREWPDDYAMRSYCTKQQREALTVLKQGRPHGIPEEVFASVRSKCAAEWPEDYSMRRYCEKQQFDSYRELESESG